MGFEVVDLAAHFGKELLGLVNVHDGAELIRVENRQRSKISYLRGIRN